MLREFAKFDQVRSLGRASFPPDGGLVETAVDPWAVKRGQLPWKTDKGELNFVIDCRAVALGVRSARDHYFVNPIDSKFVATGANRGEAL